MLVKNSIGCVLTLFNFDCRPFVRPLVKSQAFDTSYCAFSAFKQYSLPTKSHFCIFLINS